MQDSTVQNVARVIHSESLPEKIKQSLRTSIEKQKGKRAYLVLDRERIAQIEDAAEKKVRSGYWRAIEKRDHILNIPHIKENLAITLLTDYFISAIDLGELAAGIKVVPAIGTVIACIEKKDRKPLFIEKGRQKQLNKMKLVDLILRTCVDFSKQPRNQDRFYAYKPVKEDAVIAAKLFADSFKNEEIKRLLGFARTTNQLTRLKAIDSEYGNIHNLGELTPVARYVRNYELNGTPSGSQIAIAKKIRRQIKDFGSQYAEFKEKMDQIRQFLGKIADIDTKEKADQQPAVFGALEKIAKKVEDPHLDDEILKSREALQKSIADYIVQAKKNTDQLAADAVTLRHVNWLLGDCFAPKENTLPEQQVSVFENCCEAIATVYTRFNKMPKDRAIDQGRKDVRGMWAQAVITRSKQQKAGVSALIELVTPFRNRARENACETVRDKEALLDDLAQLKRFKGLIGRVDEEETRACALSIAIANRKIGDFDAELAELGTHLEKAKQLPFSIADSVKASPDIEFVKVYKTAVADSEKLEKKVQKHSRDDGLLAIIAPARDSLAIAREILSERREKAEQMALTEIQDLEKYAAETKITTISAHQQSRAVEARAEGLLSAVAELFPALVNSAMKARADVKVTSAKYFGVKKQRFDEINRLCEDSSAFLGQIVSYFNPPKYNPVKIRELKAKLDEIAARRTEIHKYGEDEALKEDIARADLKCGDLDRLLSPLANTKMMGYSYKMKALAPKIDEVIKKSWKQAHEIKPLQDTLKEVQVGLETLLILEKPNDEILNSTVKDYLFKIATHKINSFRECERASIKTAEYASQLSINKWSQRELAQKEVEEIDSWLPAHAYLAQSDAEGSKKDRDKVAEEIRKYDAGLKERVENLNGAVKSAVILLQAAEKLNAAPENTASPAELKNLTGGADEAAQLHSQFQAYLEDDHKKIHGVLQQLKYYDHALQDSLKDISDREVGFIRKEASGLTDAIGATQRSTLQEIRKLEPLDNTADLFSKRYQELKESGIFKYIHNEKASITDDAVAVCLSDIKRAMNNIKAKYNRTREINMRLLNAKYIHLNTCESKLPAKAELGYLTARTESEKIAAQRGEPALAEHLAEYLKHQISPFVEFLNTTRALDTETTGFWRDDGLKEHPLRVKIAECEAKAKSGLEKLHSGLTDQLNEVEMLFMLFDKDTTDGVEKFKMNAKYPEAAKTAYKILDGINGMGFNSEVRIKFADSLVAAAEKAADEYPRIYTSRSVALSGLQNRFTQINPAVDRNALSSLKLEKFSGDTEEYIKTMDLYWQSADDWRRDSKLVPEFKSLDAVQEEKTAGLKFAYQTIYNELKTKIAQKSDELDKMRKKPVWTTGILELMGDKLFRIRRHEKEIAEYEKLNLDARRIYDALQKSRDKPKLDQPKAGS